MNEQFFLVMLFGLAFVLYAVFVTYVKDCDHDPMSGTRAFIKQWNAEWQSGEFSRCKDGRIAFLLDGRPVVLEFTGAGSNVGWAHTRLIAPLSGINLRMELRPQWLHSSWGRLLNVEEIQLRSPYFDEAFVIHGSPPEQVRALLTPEVQEAIWKLARCSPFGRFDLHLLVSGGQLRVSKQGRLLTEKELSSLVRVCGELLRRIHELDLGINIIPPGPRPLAAVTECQVCGDPLQEKVIYCLKCKTPHHLDCWQYFGSCAVYGCGQKRYSQAKHN